MKKHGIVSIALVFVLVLGMAGNVFAADQAFIDQVRKEYTNFESKSSADYTNFRDSETEKYETYKSKESNSLESFVKQTEKDLQALDQILNQDLQQLEALYSGNNSYSNMLRQYRIQTSLTHLGSAMHQYNNSVNPNFLGSLMHRYNTIINENHLNGSMIRYKNAVNENYLSSAMQKYNNAVNQNYLNSPMFRLNNGSSTTYLNSVMFRYNRGQLTKQQARKQWDELLQKEKAALQTIINDSKASLKQTEETTKANILRQKVSTVNGILQQRKASLTTVSNLRKEYFGEGLTFDPLIPDLGDINVFLNEEWLGFEQPPVIRNGSTLVPMRAIFEKLEAEVVWNQQTRSVTATKQGSKITLTIDNKTAYINGNAMNLDTAPTLINGYTMVPLRFVSESLGAEVKWDAKTRSVFIINK